MPGRSFNSNSYRFGMNGQEKDDEITGTTGSHYTAQFWEYDSRICRRWNIEPKFMKYPFLSPYNTFENNPIYFKDPNGEDGIAVISNETQTITIKAIYYMSTKPTKNEAPSVFTEYTSKDVKYLNDKVNNLLNSYNYIVTEGQYAGYSVKFDLTFYDGGDRMDCSSQGVDETYAGIHIGNYLFKGTEKSDPKIFSAIEKNSSSKDGTIEVRGGVTVANKWIMMRAGYISLRSEIHEFFHTLFLHGDKADEGIRSYNDDMPNECDINEMIENPELKKVEEVK